MYCCTCILDFFNVLYWDVCNQYMVAVRQISSIYFNNTVDIKTKFVLSVYTCLIETKLWICLNVKMHIVFLF